MGAGQRPGPLAAPWAGASLLVVEDDEELAAAVAERLRQEGFGVTVVHDGEAALQSLAGRRFDAVVLDIMLPGLDGFEVCRRLRQEQRRIPVLMVTALADVADRMTGFDVGADDYLAKPFDVGELAARLRAVLRRDVGVDVSYLTVGDLRADVLTRRVWRGSSELQLSPREFAVLELFLRHPGVALTRHTILGAVWGRSAAPSDNIVDQYVARVRRKVDRPFGRADLETLHRVGWRLRADPPS